MNKQNDVLARYAALRASLDQPVTVTELMAPAFRAVYDFAVAQCESLAQANALWQEHGLRVQLDEARRERDKHGKRARLAEAEADQLREHLALASAYLVDAHIDGAGDMSSLEVIEKLIEVCDEQTDAAQLSSRERDRWQARYMERAAVRIVGDDSLSLGYSWEPQP